MNKQYWLLVQELFKVTTDPIGQPEGGDPDQVHKLLGQLASLEKAQEIHGTALAVSKLTRSLSDAPAEIGEDPIAFTLQVGETQAATVSVQVAMTPAGYQVIGVLYADAPSTWDEFSVILIREEIIQDFVDTQAGVEFQLQTEALGEIKLKFISSIREIVVINAQAILD